MNRNAQMMTLPEGRAQGFTLLELVISTALVTVIAVGVGQFFLASSSAYTSLAKRSQLSTRTQVVLNRLCEEIITGRFLTMDPPIPFESDRLRFDKIVGFARKNCSSW